MDAGPKVNSTGWDLLVYILYDRNYERLEARRFTPELYQRLFENKSKLTLEDMLKGELLLPKPVERAELRPSRHEPILIFTDGACQGNPGPGGWGAIIMPAGGQVRELSGGARNTTNNQMELTAAIEALKSVPVPSRVTLTTDSQYMQKGITLWIHSWKRNGWRTSDKKPVKNADLWRALDALNQQHEVEWQWVKGHAGHPENERCDELARLAIKEGTA